MEKKQLLMISNNSNFVTGLKEGLSQQFEINTANSLPTGYHTALNLLPDVIVIDQASLSSQNFKNLSNFKSTHFLNKCWLIMYSEDKSRGGVDKYFKGVVDEVVYASSNFNNIISKIINRAQANVTLTNYWKDAFMGLFNLMANPVVLLQQEDIVSMNDSFKKTFKIEDAEGAKLTDFVNCENKAKVKESLRNFARGKHMKAVTKTSLKLKNNKIRNAKISFSKLDKMINGQYIMMIHFIGEENLVTEDIGTSSKMVENCFEENTELASFNFTKREKEIIQLLCKGYKTKEISETLFISPKTIEKHRANIIKRTNSETILESIIYAINHNLVEVNYA